MKRVVYYHKNCLDGFMSGLVAFLRFGIKDTTYIPINYDDLKSKGVTALKDCFGADAVYMVDFSIKKEIIELLVPELKGELIIIDHHESVFKDLGLDFVNQTYDLYPNVSFHLSANERSGAILACDYFFPNLDRLEPEYNPLIYPRACVLADDGDRWQFKFSNDTRAFRAAMQANMSSWKIDKHWVTLLQDDSELLNDIMSKGTVLDNAHKSAVSMISLNAKYTVFDEWNVNMVNANKLYASDLGNYLAVHQIKHYPVPDFGMVWQYIDSKDIVEVSLRSVGDFNVADVAAKYGGGGHEHSAGFTMSLTKFMSLQKY